MARSDDHYYVYLASRGENPSDVDELSRILNNGLNKNRSLSRVLTVDSRSEKHDRLIQLADLLTGAVSFQIHNRHLNPTSNIGKNALAERLCLGIGRSSLATPCGSSMRPFNVWFFQLGPKQPSRPPRPLPSSWVPRT